MNKEEFMMQFVLNRASTNIRTDGEFWAQQAAKAWSVIQTETSFKEGVRVVEVIKTNTPNV